jgi:CelD/BcsL family acetyltransferase involved in cellulose biosynthesis
MADHDGFDQPLAASGLRSTGLERPLTSRGVQVNLILNRSALRRLLPEWWGLWQRAVAATPFQSPAWLVPWWETYHSGDLFMIAVRVHGELVGLLPLYREVGQYGRRLLPIGISVSDYFDALVDPAHRGVVQVGFLEALAGNADLWDTLSLEEMSEWAEGHDLPMPEGFAIEDARQSACPVLGLATLQGTPRRIRKALRRAVRLGPMRIVAADASQVEPLLEILIGLHTRRWQSRGEPGVLSDERIQAFHRAAAPRLQAAGLLRFYGLEIAGEIVGAYYGFVHRGRAYGYLSGFDPRYTPESPGTILLDHAIRQAAAEGCTEFDFLRGQEAYKYAWGAVDRWTLRRTITRSVEVGNGLTRGSRPTPTQLPASARESR